MIHRMRVRAFGIGVQTQMRQALTHILQQQAMIDPNQRTQPFSCRIESSKVRVEVRFEQPCGRAIRPIGKRGNHAPCSFLEAFLAFERTTEQNACFPASR